MRLVVCVLVCKAGDRPTRNEPHLDLIRWRECRGFVWHLSPLQLSDRHNVHRTVVFSPSAQRSGVGRTR